MTEDEFKVFFEKVKREPRPCIVCDGEPYLTGLFEPKDSQEFGAREGKTRIIAYWLCRRHASWTKIPHKLTEIEDILKRKLRYD